MHEVRHESSQKANKSLAQSTTLLALANAYLGGCRISSSGSDDDCYSFDYLMKRPDRQINISNPTVIK